MTYEVFPQGRSAGAGPVPFLLGYIPTVADIPAQPTYVHAVAFLGGYNAENDGGGGILYWNPTSLAPVPAHPGLTFFGGSNVNPLVPGRWERQIYSDALSVRAFGARLDGTIGVAGSGTPEGAVWNAAMTALAGTGIDLFGPAGASNIDTPLNPVKTTVGGVRRGMRVILQAGCALQSSIVDAGNNASSIFFATPTLGTVGALAANIAAGDSTLLCNTNFGGGTLVMLQGGVSNTEHGGIYTVISAVPSGGNFLLTVDRPILQSFSITDPEGVPSVTRVLARLEDFELIGPGKVTGTGRRAIELLGAYRCHVRKVVIDESAGHVTAGGFLCSFDVGSLECTYEEVTATSTVAVTLLQFESAEDSWAIDCRAYGNSGAAGSMGGIALADCKGGGVRGGAAWGCIAGVLLTTNGGLTVSTDDSEVDGIDCYGNVDGIVVEADCANTKIVGVTCRANSTRGILLRGGGPQGAVTNARSKGTLISASCTKGNATGIEIAAGVKGTELAAVDVSGNSTRGLNAQDDVTINGITARGGNDTAAVLFAGTTSNMTGFDFSSASNAWQAIQCSAGRVNLENGKVNGTGGASYVMTTGGFGSVVATRNVKGVAHFGVYLVTGDTLFWGDGTDFDSCVTPVTFLAGSFPSWLQVAATAGVAVNVPFPAIKTFAQVRLRLEVIIGTPGYVPLVAVTQNVGFSITSALGDNCVYRADVALS